MSNEIRKIDSGNLYNFSKIGSYGRFTSDKSFPIDFISTSFTINELCDYLTFARDIKPEQLDFDLLIQRDIDEERVLKEIAPYLYKGRGTTSNIKTRALFFPPLLVSIVPTINKEMQKYYPNEQQSENAPFDFVREWDSLFRLNFFEDNSSSSYQMSSLDNSEVVQNPVNISQVKIELSLTKGNQYGANLVVIDGQHRLCALKEINEKNPSALEHIIVPVCILFAPNATQEYAEYYHPLKIPSIPEVFRNLFVDVNKTVELVSGHFNILLSDNNIGSLVCRQFCETLLNEMGQEALATVEWNTRRKKDSTILKRDYSITSIGIIELALLENLKNKKRLTSYMLNLFEVEEELKPQDCEEYDNEEYPDVNWETFSQNQKEVLVKQVQEYLVPNLISIFYNTDEYNKALTCFKEEILKLESLKNSDDIDSHDVNIVLNKIFETTPIKSGKNYEHSRKLFSDFEKEMKKKEGVCYSSIIKYAIFQRGMIKAWLSYIEKLKEYKISIFDSTSSFIKLLNNVLDSNGIKLNYTNSYMQHTVFLNHKIKPKNETRNIISNLILSFLGNDNILNEVLKDIELENSDDYKTLKTKLSNDGYDCASKFMQVYETEKRKNFIGSYNVNFTIDQESRNELYKAHQSLLSQTKDIKEGLLKEQDLVDEFNPIVDEYVNEEVRMASNDYKISLGYSRNIISSFLDDENESDSGE